MLGKLQGIPIAGRRVGISENVPEKISINCGAIQLNLQKGLNDKLLYTC